MAHQGGWDEILLVGGPIVVIIALLAVAKRRVDAAAANSVTPESATADAAESTQDRVTPNEG